MFGKLRKKSAYELIEAAPQSGVRGAPKVAAVPKAPAVPKAAPSPIAPGTEIGYHPDLIARFEGHHASLRKLLESVRSDVTNDEFADAQKSLQSFRRALGAHLLEENIKLYTYLAKCLSHDPGSFDLVKGMKSEMGEIGTVVMRFLNKYKDAGITPANKALFLKQLGEIGETLEARIEQEETYLYTMYMPPGAFN